MEYQCNIRTRFIRSHCSGKTSVTIDALFLLEHAASHHATGETEKTQSYGWWWIVVLQSSSTVRTVVTEIMRLYHCDLLQSSTVSLTPQGSRTPPCISPYTSHTSRTSRQWGPWPDNNIKILKLASQPPYLIFRCALTLCRYFITIQAFIATLKIGQTSYWGLVISQATKHHRVREVYCRRKLGNF